MAGRIFLFLFAAFFASADGLDDAVTQLARKISAHLAADEVAHVTWAGVTQNDAALTDSAPEADKNRVMTVLARGLQKRLRNPKQVEVTATLSRNLKGYLVIAEVQREGGNIVEMASAPRAAAAPRASAGLRIEKRLLWEQEEPMLDVTVIGDQGDQMLVLDLGGVTRYERRDAKWQRAEAVVLEIPPVRDPRGRITVMENSLEAEVAGLTCRGTWRPAVALDCQPGGRFTAGRNTIEETGWPPHFTHAEVGGEHVIAGIDGRIAIYDAARKQLAVSDLWGDFAVVQSNCAGAKIAASAHGTHLAPDSIALYELVNHAPSRVSDETEVPGPVTAMWPAGSTALAVVRNKNTERYEAYSVGVDCGR